ncbi:MAG: hypothetical protein IMZ47_01110 [Firmicutes bacterium]|nr:hypothetical protein [Bacillota bacterium]
MEVKKINKKLKWSLIGLGIFFGVMIIAAICFFVYFVIATGVNVLHKEFTPETKIPTKIEQSISTVSTEGTTTTNVKENLKINDLAYIKILVVGYSAGASPRWDGISIDIGFYNSKSENIDFESIPITANIKIYATRINFDTGKEETIEPAVYEGNIEIDHSMRLSEMFGKYIRIPFKDFGQLPIKDNLWGKGDIIKSCGFRIVKKHILR